MPGTPARSASRRRTMRSSFITWYPYCRRSDTIAAALGGTSHLVHYLSFKHPLHAPLKYPMQAATTWRILSAERPDLVLVAVPPIFDALAVGRYARRHHARFVIDAHTGIFLHRRWRWLLPLTRAISRRADAVIVTGEHLAGVVSSWAAHPVIIGDVPVQIGPGRPPAAIAKDRVVVVNTFSVDEPVAALLAAAGQVPTVEFFITGDVRYAPSGLVDGRPSNARFTGFLPEEDYAGLLRAADAIVVLTDHDHTMQRGAYEAVAVEKPLVTSNWGLLRETFSRGTVHVENEPAAIAAGVRLALAERTRLSGEMQILRREREALFAQRLGHLLDVVGTSSASADRPRAGTNGSSPSEELRP